MFACARYGQWSAMTFRLSLGARPATLEAIRFQDLFAESRFDSRSCLLGLLEPFTKTKSSASISDIRPTYDNVIQACCFASLALVLSSRQSVDSHTTCETLMDLLTGSFEKYVFKKAGLEKNSTDLFWALIELRSLGEYHEYLRATLSMAQVDDFKLDVSDDDNVVQRKLTTMLQEQIDALRKQPNPSHFAVGKRGIKKNWSPAARLIATCKTLTVSV